MIISKYSFGHGGVRLGMVEVSKTSTRPEHERTTIILGAITGASKPISRKGDYVLPKEMGQIFSNFLRYFQEQSTSSYRPAHRQYNCRDGGRPYEIAP